MAGLSAVLPVAPSTMVWTAAEASLPHAVVPVHAAGAVVVGAVAEVELGQADHANALMALLYSDMYKHGPGASTVTTCMLRQC